MVTNTPVSPATLEHGEQPGALKGQAPAEDTESPSKTVDAQQRETGLYLSLGAASLLGVGFLVTGQWTARRRRKAIRSAAWAVTLSLLGYVAYALRVVPLSDYLGFLSAPWRPAVVSLASGLFALLPWFWDRQG
jgi:hypothetical protein